MSDEKRCARCGRTERVMGSVRFNRAGEWLSMWLCHANPDGTKSDPDCYHLVTVCGSPPRESIGRYTPLQMQIDRLRANRLKITGYAGDEALLDEVIASLRAQLAWLKDTEFEAAIDTAAGYYSC